MPSAAVTVAAVAGSGVRGLTDGPAAAARFYRAWDLAVAPDGSYFVADFGNHRVRRVAPDGAVTTVSLPGTGPSDREAAVFDGPAGVAVDRRGTVYVTEFGKHRLRKIARTAGGGWAVSTVVAAGLRHPLGVAVDPAGHPVVADMGNHRVVRVDPATGALTVLAGDGTDGFRDGPGATARLSGPAGVAVDRVGDVFVAEAVGHRVRRICAADGVVSTVAGSGGAGHGDGVGATAQFQRPVTVAVDGRGVLLVSDGTDELRLRRVAASADRTVSTVVVEGDPHEPATCSAIDHDGSLLIAVRGTNQIFRVSGLGLAPPSAPAWALRAHRGLAAAAPAVGTFVATLMLCALRLDADIDGGSTDAVPRLPLEMWLAILSMLRPDQMLVPRQ